MMMPQGTTVTSIHSAWTMDRRKDIRRPRFRRVALFALEQEVDEGRQVFVHAGVRRVFGRQRHAAAGRAHAGQQQVRLAAGGGAGLQVAQAVAGGRHVGQVDAVALADLQEQARLGLRHSQPSSGLCGQ